MDKIEKIEKYQKLNRTVVPGKIVCAGSSLMEMFPIAKFLDEIGDRTIIYNRGIGGFVIKELMETVDVCILDLHPFRLFLNIGTNDLSNPSVTLDMLIEDYECLLTIIEKTLPQTEIYLMAYYPVNYEAATEEMKKCLLVRTNDKIKRANSKVHELADKHGARYIDINKNLVDEKGRLKKEFTIEGLHINEMGYRAVFPEFMEYVREKGWKQGG